jgi:histidinol-phosphatase (PHP family)
MTKVNYHMHTTISDGKVKPEELIKLCIRNKFDTIAITDHYRFPPGFRDFGNNRYSDNHYKILNSLKKKYQKQINILVGVEFDWIEGYEQWIKKETKKRKYDYKLISIHFLKVGDEYFPIDYSKDLYDEMITKFGGIKKLVINYYSNLRKAINLGLYDAVGHLDLIKIWNKNHFYFNEKEKWYVSEIQKTLEAIKQKKMIIDFNTKGLRTPCGEQYPSGWIIKEAMNKGIKMRIGTDTHKKEEIDVGIKEINALLKSLR